MYAKLGKAYCYSCNRQIKAHSVETIMNDMNDRYADRKVYFLQDI
jgi:excinuclease UvrABC ATPase subunit